MGFPGFPAKEVASILHIMEVQQQQSIYTDPRFLDVVRELRGIAPPAELPEDDAADEVTKRVRAKIALRVKQRQMKEKRDGVCIKK